MHLLDVQHISKSFDHRTEALTDVSFTVDAGEFISVIGRSGSGKTTLFRILNGALTFDQGEILTAAAGKSTGAVSMSGHSRRKKREIQKTIGTIYQDFCLIESVSCLQNVLNACLPDMSFFSGALGLFGKEKRQEAALLLERVGLSDKLDEPVANLSGGQKQRVAIARALMRHPVLLLADEPVASLDPATGKEILDLLADIRQKEGVTILMNSHNLDFSRFYSSRLIGLSDGRIVYDGLPGDLDDAALHTIY